MRTIVYGQARTGTSALYFALQRTAVPETVCYFEPPAFDVWALPPHALVKTLVASLPGDEICRPLDPLAFDRRLVLVRDPRDRLISLLLFLPHWSHAPSYPPLAQRAPQQLQRYLALLRQKVTAPTTVSVATLFTALMDLRFGLLPHEALSRLHRLQRHFMAFEGSLPDRELVRYEAFAGPPPPRAYAQVRRTGTSGEWRQWFLRRDIATFAPVFTPYLTWYGYRDEWDVAAHPVIAPAGSLHYVEKWLRVQRRAAHATS